MHTKKLEVQYTYDPQRDILNIEIKKDYKHNKTIELSFGVFLDFDDENLPVNLEIISASKVLETERKSLINPKVNIDISVSQYRIDVDISLENKKEIMGFADSNSYGFPDSQTSFALHEWND